MRLAAKWRAGALIGCGLWLAACSADNRGAEPAAPKSASSAAAPTTKIVVQPGQSLDAIAQAVHIPKRDIIALNHLAPPYRLRAGAILELPAAAAAELAAKPKAKSRPEHARADAAPAPVRTARVAPQRRPNPKPAEVIPLD
jgi:LysM repeat protein